MKRPLIYIVLLVVLAAIALFLYMQDQQSTLDAGFTNFGVKNTGKIDSIRLSQGEKAVHLQRRNNRWYVNGQTYAREKAVRQFFNLLEDLQVEAPATENNRDELISQIRENPVEVNIYQGGQRIRDYLVEENPAREGPTYMMMTESRRPFLMSLPGFQGDLASLFRVEPEYWRDRTLFDYSGLDLKAIEVVYPSRASASFMLTYSNDQFRLKSLEDKRFLEDFSSNKAARYFSYFGNVRFHSVMTDKPRLLDSLRQSQPYCTIRLADVDGNQRKLMTYRKQSSGTQDAFGQQSRWDLNYLYGRYEHSGEILLIKYTEIDPLLKEINYFRKN